DADGPVGGTDRFDGFEDGAHRDRLAAPRTEAVLADVEQRRREVVDQARRLRRGRRGGEEAIGHSSPSIRSRTYPLSRSGAMPKPEPSRLSRPMKSTGALPATARRTSSTICPVLFSYTAMRRAPLTARATASVGKGKSVIGRTNPTRAPSERSRDTAART